MSEQNSNRGIRQTLLGIFAFIFLVMLAFVNKINTQHILSPQELMDNGAVLLETPRKFSGLELTDHQGRPFTSTNLQGKWTLFFFGFTSCPDICPTTMSTAANLYESLSSEDQKLLQFTMISLDPERDTTEKLAQYVPYFNKDFIGVTVEYMRSPSSADSWHYRKGYTGAPLACEGFIHEKKTGQVARLTHYF